MWLYSPKILNILKKNMSPFSSISTSKDISVLLASIKAKATTSTHHNKKYNKRNNHSPKRNNPSPLPPKRTTQLPTRILKPKRLLIQPIRLIHKQLDLLSSLQHLLDVFHHDVFHIFDLRFDDADFVHGGFCVGGVVVVHSRFDDGCEFFVHREGYRFHGQVEAVVRHEAVFHVVQKGVGYAVFVLFVGHAEVADGVFDYVVEDVVVVHVGHFAVGGRYFGEEDSRYCWKVSCCLRRVFGERGGVRRIVRG
mmetsp:Transcript_4070/g.5472  ORF Transcript_4070/g.5472 Transcript_4070/m.5472 type:complete len:251 (+) Transcript_4070:267-1019(+)